MSTEVERLQFEQKEWQRLHAQIAELQVDLDACRAERDDRLARFTRLALGSDGRGLPDNTLIPVAEIRAAILEPFDAAIAKRAKVTAATTEVIDQAAMAKFERRLKAAFDVARADMAADIDVEAELARFKARAAAWYPNARCANPAQHEAHPWGDPIHWCGQVTPS